MRCNRNAMQALNGEAGFTIVELLVVTTILAMLAVIAGPPVFEYFGRAKTQTTRVQISAIVSALQIYALDNGGFPPEEIGLRALVEAPNGAARWSGPYLTNANGLIDPWSTPYRYKIVNGQVKVFSLGRDNAVGGRGEDQDVSN